MMRKLCYISFVLFFCSCIDQIELDTNNLEPEVVIDGVFSTQAKLQEIKLSKSIRINSQINNPLSGASVSVISSDGLEINFFEDEPGRYVTFAAAEKGKSYQLVVDLPDNQRLTSNSQMVPDSIPINEINIIDTMVTFVNESGQFDRLRAIEFYAYTQMPELKEDAFIRYHTETVYQVLETKCSPFHDPKACYFYNDQRPLQIDLVELNQSSEPLAFQSFAYRRKIDYNLAEKFALVLSTYNYNKEEFEYWKQLKSIFDQNGNITDTKPAKLVGNMSYADGTKALGQFAVVGESTTIKLIGNADFPTQIRPYCGLPGLLPWPLPDECCNCLNLKNANLLKPPFWP